MLPLPFPIVHSRAGTGGCHAVRTDMGCHCTEHCNPPWLWCLTGCSSAKWWFRSSSAPLSAAAWVLVGVGGSSSVPTGEWGLYLVCAGTPGVEDKEHWSGVSSVTAGMSSASSGSRKVIQVHKFLMVTRGLLQFLELRFPPACLPLLQMICFKAYSGLLQICLQIPVSEVFFQLPVESWHALWENVREPLWLPRLLCLQNKFCLDSII